MPEEDSLGDRMKAYEARETSRRFMPLCPVVARIDGRSFSAFTRGMIRPYDVRMIQAMIETTKALVAETSARIGYTQSDEINLVWLAERYDSGIFFDGRVFKITSALASYATAAFTRAVLSIEGFERYAERLPHFDARVWQVPNEAEAANVFLWRNLDATKNALSMAASHYYSDKQLFRKNGSDKHEMLFEAGVNFDTYPEAFKRGTFVRRVNVERTMTLEELARIPEKHRPEPGAIVMRTEVREVPMPPFSRVANRTDVVFRGAEPQTEHTQGE
jgi:tRNA(His) 5'-end guanylyltransferase